MEKRLYRSTRDRIFGGVCGGLSEYAQVEKGLLRFLTAIAIVVTGFIPGLIAYVVCVLVIPTEEAVFKDQMYRESGENPPPKAASIRLSPFLSLFSNSQRTRGIVAAVVLP